MNIQNIKTMTLVVAAFAIAAPGAQAQARRGGGVSHVSSTSGSIGGIGYINGYPTSGYNAINNYGISSNYAPFNSGTNGFANTRNPYNGTNGYTNGYPTSGYNAVNNYAGLSNYPGSSNYAPFSYGTNGFSNGYNTYYGSNGYTNGYPTNGYNAVNNYAGLNNNSSAFSGLNGFTSGTTFNSFNGVGGYSVAGSAGMNGYNNSGYNAPANNSTSAYTNGVGAVNGGNVVLPGYGLGYGPVEVGANGEVTYPVVNNSNVQTPITSDQIKADKLPGNMVKITWQGDPKPVARMRFSLLDKNGTVLRNVIITDLPAEAIFSKPSTAASYRVSILYGDGAVRSIVAPL